MAKAQIWDCVKHEYTPYEIPADWHCPLICQDMNTLINCVSCGKEMTFGEGYTSRFIHNISGFGYYVCEECMEIEWAVEKAARKRECE